MSVRNTWLPAYVALGSNLSGPAEQIRRACVALTALPATRLLAVSALYRNPPLGVIDQPDFVNAVAGLLTQLTPRELMSALKGIESAQGRDRSAGDRWGPRVLDLDLLMHGTARISEDGLTLPHPGIAERNFVLFPLMEIAPDLSIPGLGPIGDLASRLDRSGLTRVD